MKNNAYVAKNVDSSEKRKGTQSNEYIVSIIFKDKMHITSTLLLLFFCFNYPRLSIEYESIFLIQNLYHF